MKYVCPKQECQPCNSYIGYTECMLVDRLRNHAQNGAIITHSVNSHDTKISTQEIAKSTTILCHFKTKEELTIAEALYIKHENPTLNQQREGETRVLRIF